MTIVISLTALLSAPFLAVFLSLHRESQARARLFETRMEARRIAFRVRHRAALAGGLSVGADNHSLDFSDGSKIFWNKSGLWERRGGQEDTLLSSQVLDLTVIERKNKTWLTLSLKLEGVTREREHRSTWEVP